MKTILVTGSNGLIGKSLCEYLYAHNLHFKEFDINLPKSHPNFGDINNKFSIAAHLEGCTGIIHLAGVSRVIWGERDPDGCWQTNVVGTQNILEAAFNSSLKPWVIYASSREVYGQQQKFPVTESASLQPLNVYAHSKVAAEELVQHYNTRGLTTAVLRFSSVYGRTDDHMDRVVPAFCRAAVLNKPFKIEGLQNTFDFTHVSDVVRGILRTIECLEHNQSLPPIHLTTGQPTTLQTLANYVCEAGPFQPEIIELPPRNFDVSKFYGDNGLAREYLGWEPSTPIKTGINQLTQDYLSVNSFTQNKSNQIYKQVVY